VDSVTFSPDGKLLACATRGGKVKVWDAQTNQPILSLEGGGRVAFSPDGKRLASTGGKVRVWDAQTGQKLVSLQGLTGRVRSVAFSPDGKHVASGSGKTVQVLDAQPSPNPLTLPLTGANRMVSVAFSPDGRRLATGNLGLLQGEPVGEAKVWDLQTGRQLFTLNTGGGPLHKRIVYDLGSQSSVAFSPDGKRLASLGPLDFGGRELKRDLKVWDAQTGQELLTIKLVGRNNPTVTSVVFSPDGKRLASGSGVEAKVWDAQTGLELLTLRHSSEVISVAFSPDGKRLASGCSGWDPQQAKDVPSDIKVWDAHTGQELRTITLTGSSNRPSVVFSPDGKRLASGSGVEAKVWDAQTGEELLTLKGHSGRVNRVVYSPDGMRLVTAGHGTIKLWDAQTGEELFTFKGHDGDGVAFSPDGHRLAAGAADGTVKIWDATPLPEKR
jgi:WD40 repeat protein